MRRHAVLILSMLAPIALQTGTCEALRSWSLSQTVALSAEVLSVTTDAGALRARICIMNKDAWHPAFAVWLALWRPLKGNAEVFQEGRCSE